MQSARQTGQRWLKWINLAGVVCPPFGVVAITGSRVVNTDIVFEADELPTDEASDPAAPWLNGVPWNAAFNDHDAVEPGGTGWLTVDLPAWGLITESLTLMSFASFRAVGGGQRWSLGTIPDNRTDYEYWPGFRVFGTRYFPDWVSTWNTRLPGFLEGNYKIGWLGGLATSLVDSLDVTAPEFE